jgi:predicted phosphodiesterase
MIGPEAAWNKIEKLYSQLGGFLLRFFFSSEGIKGKKISKRQLLNIEYYLEKYCEYEKFPRWFIFGHTHRQDKGKTNRLKVNVYNAGSCYRERDMPITFIEIEIDAEG